MVGGKRGETNQIDDLVVKMLALDLCVGRGCRALRTDLSLSLSLGFHSIAIFYDLISYYASLQMVQSSNQLNRELYQKERKKEDGQ